MMLQAIIKFPSSELSFPHKARVNGIKPDNKCSMLNDLSPRYKSAIRQGSARYLDAL